MKLLAIVLICGLLALVQGRALLEEDKPEGPRYKVLNATDSLELRQYDEATWAVAFGRSAWSIDLASFWAGKALVGYFSGANVAHTAIKPTVPLIATILLPPHHKHGNSSQPHPPHKNKTHPHPPRLDESPVVALAGFIPSKFGGDAPIPDCPRVKILHTNSTDVYVHNFGGWSFGFVVRHEIRHLALALADAGICPFSGKFFVATYQGPFQVFDRRNEILWVKKPKHNDTEGQAGEFDVKTVGMGALDVHLLFPEEFPSLEEPALADVQFKPTAQEKVPAGSEMTQQSAVLDVVQIS